VQQTQEDRQILIKAVFFDLDNTLVDFFRMKQSSVRAAVVAMLDAGLDGSFDETLKQIMEIYKTEGIEYQKVFDSFLEARLGEINYKILASAVVAYRKAREASLVLYPHVTATLTSLVRRGIKLAIITDAPPMQAWLRLCHLNLHHLFDTVIVTEELGALKPSPIPFRKALERLDVQPSQALMIGDWPERDIVGAKKVGIRTVFARYGDPRDVEESFADYEIDDISELNSIIEGLG